MGDFHPKAVLREALELEKKGNKRGASRHFSALSVYLRKREKYVEALLMIERAIKLGPRSARLYIQKCLVELGMAKGLEAKASIELFTKHTIKRNKIIEFTPYLEQQLEAYPTLRQYFYEQVIKIERTTALGFLGLARALKAQSFFDEAQAQLVLALKTKDREEEVFDELEDLLRRRNSSDELEYLSDYRQGKMEAAAFYSLLEPKNYQSLKDRKSGKSAISLVPFGTNASVAGKDQNIQERERTLKSLIADLEEDLAVDTSRGLHPVILTENESQINGEEGIDTVQPLIAEFKSRSAPILDGDAAAQMDMAVAFLEMGLTRDAAEFLSKITEGDPYFWKARSLIGEICFNEGSYLAALEVFQEVLRAEDFDKNLEKLSRYMLAQIYLRLGDLGRAHQQAMRLYKMDPNYRNLTSIRAAIDQRMPVEPEGRSSVKRSR